MRRYQRGVVTTKEQQHSHQNENPYLPRKLNSSASSMIALRITRLRSRSSNVASEASAFNFNFDSRSTASNDSSTLLSKKLVGDVVIGTTVTFALAPFLSIVDKAIVQRAAGSQTLVQSAADSFRTILRNPLAYAKSPAFLWMWAVYASTYSAANSLKTITEHEQQRQKSRIDTNAPIASVDQSTERYTPAKLDATSAGLAVFLGTAAVNSGVSLLKDRAYAQMFGSSSPKSIPKVTYGLWMTRDLMVVGSSFVLPDMASQYLQTHHQMPEQKSKHMAQICIPIVMQLAVTPFQLLGLDFYNRSNVSWISRGQAVAESFSSVVSARMIRMSLVYSLGGVLNTFCRDSWREHLELLQEEHTTNNSSSRRQEERPRRRFLPDLVTSFSVLANPVLFQHAAQAQSKST